MPPRSWTRVVPFSVTSEDDATNASHQLRMAVTSRTFRAIWVATACVHIANGVFLGAVAVLYRFITTPEMVYFVPTLHLPSIHALRLIGVTYWGLCGCHAIALATMAKHSIRQRRLCFIGSTPPDGERLATMLQLKRTRLRQRSEHFRRASRVVNTLLQKWYRVFGLDSPYFDSSFALREAIQIVLQSYQAYLLSQSISSTWINTLAVTTIFLNCMTTPIIHRLQTHGRLSVAQARVLCVVSDAVLDVTNSVIVPLAVFLPYWIAFDLSTYYFPANAAYDEVWYTNAIQENRQLFILSTVDFASTFAPHVSLLLCMKTIKRRTVEACASPVRPTPSSCRPTTKGPIVDVHDRQAVSTRIVRLLLCCWGCVVLAAHITAHVGLSDVASCKLHNNAWFSSGFPCAVMELDCHRLGTLGSAAVLDNELAKLATTSLSLLSVVHCPRLEMPSRIREFPNLTGLIVLNATVIQWEDPTALSREFLPTLSYLEFIYVNFSDTGLFPPALAQGDFSPTLTDIEIYGSNLKEIPGHVDSLWPKLLTLYIEFCELTFVPSAIFRLESLQFLSLAGNQIPMLPDDALMPRGATLLAYLALSGNPINRLPPQITDTSLKRLQELHVEYTLVAELPEWVHRWYDARHERDGVYVAAYGSPVCGSSSTNATPTTVHGAFCSSDLETRRGLVPVERIASQHVIQ